MEMSGQLHVSFTSEEGAPSMHWTGAWVSHKASFDMMEKRKLSIPAYSQTPISMSFSFYVSRYTN
jgi:hypothetical protein